MPWLPEDDEDDKPTDMVAMIEMLNTAFGGDDLRPKQDSSSDLAYAIAARAKELIDQDRQTVSQETHEYPWEP